MDGNRKKAVWKDTVPEQLKPVGNPEGDLNLKEMLHSRSVIAGLIAACLGILIAFVSYKFCTGHLRMLLAFAAAALAFTGTGQITKYINDNPVAHAQGRRETGKRD